MSTELSEILEQVDMGWWLSREGLDYREANGSSGRQLNVRCCPVCNTAKWKVYLNAETGLGNCFGGDHPPGENFTKFNFIQAQLGLTRKGTVDYLQALAPELGYKRKRLSSVMVRPEDPGLFGVLQLPINGRNLAYLENRGFNLDYVRYFGWGYVHQGYYRYRMPDGWKFTDFSRRIYLPVFDLDGNYVTFQGRDVTGAAEKKYLFPTGMPASGAYLYNGNNVAAGTAHIVVGEGVFDVAAIKKALDEDPGLRDVVPVGTFGMHLSSGDGASQLNAFAALYARGVRRVTLMWDGELRATQAAVEAGMLLRQIGFEVFIAQLPPDKDPNEVAPSVVRQAFYQAVRLDATSRLRIVIDRMRASA